MGKRITEVALLVVSAFFGCGGEAEGLATDAGPAEPSLDFDVIYIEVDEGEAPAGDIGTLEQGLTIPTGYGTVPGGGRCWSGVDCRHPGSKTYPRNFKASTCDPWQQSRWVGGEIRAMAMTSPDGSSAKATWTLSTGTKNTFQCGTNAQAITLHPSLDGSLGVAIITSNNATKKYIKSDIWIFPENMENEPGWWGRSISEVEKFYENAIAHEIIHSMGIDHADSMGGSVLMRSAPSLSYYSNFLTVNGTERGWLIDYQP